MIISIEVLVIYLGMVVFGLIAYAVIIPYFVVRRFRRMLSSGEGASWLMGLLESEISVKDEQGQEKKTMLVNWLISIAIMNLKMQLNSLKSAMVRSIMCEGGEEPGEAMNAWLDAVPRKWRWVAQLALPLLASRMQQVQSTAPGTSAVSAYKGA